MATSHTLLGNFYQTYGTQGATVAGILRAKWRVTADGGGGGTETISNADILAAFPPLSPLFALFNKTYASQTAARDALTNSQIVSVYLTPRTGAATVYQIDVNIDGSSLPVLQVVVSAASSEVVVELVYNHTHNR